MTVRMKKFVELAACAAIFMSLAVGIDPILDQLGVWFPAVFHKH